MPAISRIVSHRLSSCSGGIHVSYGNLCPKFLRRLLEDSFASDELELGHTMAEACREDANAIVARDPAVETLLEAVLFCKGFHSLVLHRAARRAWKPGAATTAAAENGAAEARSPSEIGGGGGGMGRRFVALLLQSQASAAFGVDIHPAAAIGAGVMFDHATGVVVGETAAIGDGSTVLHGVTLGGTGKEHGDRHPKVGRDVLIGAGTQILGNVTVGDRAKIGAGSVVLRPIPGGATAVGAPAKIIGFTREERPGAEVDSNLEVVEPLTAEEEIPGAESSGSLSALTEETTTMTESEGSGNVAAAAVTGGARTEPVPNEGDSAVWEKGRGGKGSVEANAPSKGDVGDGDGEDDDNVTDFGTKPRCRFAKAPCHGGSANDDLCPFHGIFRSLVSLPSSVRRDCVSNSKLRELLLQYGCSEGEVVEVFFELLHRTPPNCKARQCGSIPLDVFSADFAEVAGEKTRLDMETRQALARGDLRTLAMSKKACRRFRSMFSALDKKQQQRVD